MVSLLEVIIDRLAVHAPLKARITIGQRVSSIRLCGRMMLVGVVSENRSCAY